MPDMPEKEHIVFEAEADMHSEAWWIRLMDNDLTAEEQRRWEIHLAACLACQQEWAALTRLDEVMRSAPEPAMVSPDFTAATVDLISRKQRLRRLMSFLGGSLIVALVSLLVFALVGSAFATLEQRLGVVIAARQVLFQSLIQTWVSLIVSWKTVLPFVIGFAVALALLMMPNGVLITLSVLWLSRRRRLVSTPSS